MKRHTCLALLLTAVASLQAQDYLIRFEGSGKKTTIDNILVRNLTNGTRLVLTGNEVLHLKSSLNHSGTGHQLPGPVAIYPNPMDNYAMLEFETMQSGNSLVDMYNISGIKLVQQQFYLPPGRHIFSLSGISNGVYLLQINAGGYLYSGKLVSTNPYTEEAEIRYISSVVNEKEGDQLKSDSEYEGMYYSSGDKLLITFTSGNYNTTISEVPVQQEIINGNFFECIDADNNNYPVVQIGNQVWMGRNLKTTRFNDGTPIPNITGSDDWADLTLPAYSWRNNDEGSFKDPYGGLYNWYAVNTDKLCPIGWHVPADSEWIALEHYLGGNSISGGTMKEEGTIHWDSPNAGADNSTGFSMIGGGYREGNGGASFYELGRGGYLWSATGYEETTARYRGFSNTGVLAERGFSSKSSGFSVRCLMNSGAPVVKTALPSSITDTSATCQGMVSSGDASAISARGICWDTGSNPDTSSNRVMDEAGGEGAFTCILTRLLPNTGYYARAFAIIKDKVFYGNVVSFKSNQFPALVRDYDGNVYKTVVIGEQTWLAENLRNTHFSNGESIPNITSSSEWVSLNTPGYCWRNNDEQTYKVPYGALYNWWAVNATSLCPLGFHVATERDFLNLESYLGGRATEGGKLKEEGNAHWDSPNAGALNLTGFTMLPGGYRDGQGSAGFYELGRGGYLWSTVEANSGSGPWYWGFNRDYEQSDRGASSLTTGFSVRCVNDDSILKVPEVYTMQIENITQNSAQSGGDMREPVVFARGICWSTEPNPDTNDYHTTIWYNNSGWQFRSQLKDLLPGTTYFVKGYAINKAGIGYGNQLTFTTLPGEIMSSVSDVEGNVYKTIKIGTQTWMAENLKTTKYADGTPIPNVIENTQWNDLNGTQKAYCYYNNDLNYGNTFGALYTWSAAMNGANTSSTNPSHVQGVCPTDWHLPSEAEWSILESYIGGSHVAGSKMKEAGNEHWLFNEDATNESGFTGLPGGYRNNNYYVGDFGGTFVWNGVDGVWWSTDEFSQNYAHYRQLNCGSSDLQSGNADVTKGTGVSVRCIWDKIDTTENVDLKKGLVAWYPFNGNANDESGNGNNGVVHGANLTANRFGSENKAYVFNGIDNYIEVPSSSSLLSMEDNNAITASAWINIKGSNYYDCFNIFGKYNTQSDYGWEFQVGGGLQIFYLNTSQGNYAITNWNSTINRWYHLAISYDQALGVIKFYLNGIQIDQQPYSVPFEKTDGALNIGFSPQGPDDYSNGIIDDIRIYNRALNNSEIQALYTEGGYIPPLPNISTDAITDITQTTAKSRGTEITEGGSPITSKGICWSTSQNPDTTDFKTNEGNGNGSFQSNLTGLLPNTFYYVRAYAVNSAGIAYGNEVGFQTLDDGSVDLQKGLVAWYPFNGNVNDESGNGHNGIINGATLTVDRFGNQDSAYFFNGQGNSITVNNFNVPPSATTISFWAKTKDSNGLEDFISKHIDSRDVEILMRINNYRYLIEWTIGGVYFVIEDNISPFIVDPNNPRFDLLTLTYDGHIARFYVNGVLAGAYSVTGQIANNSYPMTFGRYAGGGLTEYLNGALDDIRIYNRALNFSEIQSLYSEED